MTSQVNPHNIDGTYPVAGADNDSQGFRDNFTNTSNNFAFVKAEIEDLQNKVVLKAALDNTTLNNDLSQATLNNAQLTAFSETYYNGGTISGAQTVDFSKGNYQRIQTGGSLILNLGVSSNWPAAGKAARLRLWLSITNTAHTVTLPSNVTIGKWEELAGIDASRVITYDTAGDYFYEFSTTDAGATVLAREIGRAPNKVHGDLTVTGNISGATAGARVEKGWQYGGNVLTGFSTQIWGNVGRIVFDPYTTVASGNVLLPNVTADGTIMKISSTEAMTFYANTNQVGTIVRPNVAVTLSAGTAAEYLYHSSENIWYKTQ